MAITKQFFTLHVLTIILTLTLTLASAKKINGNIKIVTGYEIPIQDLNLRFPHHSIEDIQTPEFQNRFYHISNSHILSGYDRKIDLQSVTDRPVPIPMNERLRNITEPLSIREGKEYGYTYTKHGRYILNAWGPNLNLNPLNHDKHPNVFIHTSYSSPSSNNINSSSMHDELSEEQAFSKFPVPNFSESTTSGKTAQVTDKLTMTTRQESIVPPGVSCRDKLPSRTMEIVATYDHTFCSVYGSDETRANAAVISAFARANSPFAIQTCLRLDLIDVESNCDELTDPYQTYKTLTEPANILSEFRTYWLSEKENTERDVAILLTGFDDGTESNGQAYQSAACTKEFGYARVEGAIPSFVAQNVGLMVGATFEGSGGEGLMRRDVEEDATLTLSQGSIDEIVRFIDEDIGGRSSCFALGKLPIGTPMPSMSATPSPIAIAKTCDANLKIGEGLGCTERKWIGEIKSNPGIVDVYVKQTQGNVVLTLGIQASAWENSAGDTKYNRRKIVEYKRRVSLSEEVGDLGERITVGDGDPSVVTEWPLLAIEGGSESCCGKTVYFHVEVVTELWIYDSPTGDWTYGGNERVSQSFQSSLDCIECSSGESLLPPSSSRQCAQCIS